MARRKFHLKRQLMYGMKGEDVRMMQQWLATANDCYRFYERPIPTTGYFDMFQTQIALAHFQDWAEMERTHCYDLGTHSYLHTCVNETLKMLNYPDYSLWDK
jgi:hypothetical protein